MHFNVGAICRLTRSCREGKRRFGWAWRLGSERASVAAKLLNLLRFFLGVPGPPLLWLPARDGRQPSCALNGRPKRKMPVEKKQSTKREVDRTRPLTYRLPGRRRADESGKIEIAILIPLLLVTNIIVATLAWYAVGAFLK
jgi:hypothetical protein